MAHMDWKDALEMAREFVNAWPIEKLASMRLDQYTGLWDKGTFCYALENGTKALGDIHGANSEKFWIYRTDKPDNGRMVQGWWYAWKKAYSSNTPQEAFENHVRKNVVEIATAAANGNLLEVEGTNFSTMVKWKIAFLYAWWNWIEGMPEPGVLPIYSPNMLNKIGEKMGFPTPFSSNFEAYQSLLRKKPVNKDTYSYHLDLWGMIQSKTYEQVIESIRKEVNLSVEQIYNLVVSLEVSNFIILSGPSWSGKSKVVQLLNKALNGSDDGAYLKFPVKSNFSDESALLGYWNPLLSKYETTPVLEFLINAFVDHEKNWIESSPRFLLLDEMNLSRIENYFSDFLARLDELKGWQAPAEEGVEWWEESSHWSEEGAMDGYTGKIPLFETRVNTVSKFLSIQHWIKTANLPAEFYTAKLDNDDRRIDFRQSGFENERLILKDFESVTVWDLEADEKTGILHGRAEKNLYFKAWIRLSRNLKVIGTINEDETTQGISYKVLDRAQYIRFEIENLFYEASNKSFSSKVLKNEVRVIDRPFEGYQTLVAQKKPFYGYFDKEFLDGKAPKDVINELNKFIEGIDANQAVGYRAIEEIANYVKRFCGDSDDPEAVGSALFLRAFDYQISQKVLPKIKSLWITSANQKKGLEGVRLTVEEFAENLKEEGSKSKAFCQKIMLNSNH